MGDYKVAKENYEKILEINEGNWIENKKALKNLAEIFKKNEDYSSLKDIYLKI